MSSLFSFPFVVAALSTLLLVACERNEGGLTPAATCHKDSDCPYGYVCADTTRPGGCRKPGLDGSVGPATLDGALSPASVDGAATADGGYPVTGVDVANVVPEDRDAATVLDDGPVSGDAAASLADVLVQVPLDSQADRSADGAAAVDAAVVVQPDANGPEGGLSVADAPADYPSDAPESPDLAKKSNGDPCTANVQCGSGFCVDGVCCNRACSGQCESCGEATKGVCSIVTGAPRGNRKACGGSGACAGQCGGVESDVCVYPSAAVQCSAAGCSGSSAIRSASFCDGAGTCAAPSVQLCADGEFCAAATCHPKKDDGDTCTSSAECANANCTNGMCCGKDQLACGGTCESVLICPQNCGACGHACAYGETCSGGKCQPPAPSPAGP